MSEFHGMGRDNFAFVFASLGNAIRYEPGMMQLSHHIIHKGTSGGPVYTYGPRAYIW
jgi:hypothetical protein